MRNTRRWAIGLGTVSLLLAGCGGTTQVVSAPETAVGDPAPSAGDGGSGGQGGQGASAGEEPQSKLERCMHRFDEVAVEPDESWDHWRSRGGMPTWRAVSEDLGTRFGVGDSDGAIKHPDSSKSDSGLRNGYLESIFDSPRDRILVVVDPRMVDRDELERALNRRAEQVQREHPVKDGAIEVEVAASCVTAKRLRKISEALMAERDVFQLQVSSGPGIDSRLHVTLKTPEAKREAERRYGSLVEVKVGEVVPL